MFRKNSIGILLHLISHFWGTMAMEIQLGYRGPGVLGGNEADLKCSFIAEPTEEVISLQIMSTNGTDSTFETIALFRPQGDANLSNMGSYLHGRVELNNSMTFAGRITLRFHYLICADEKEYKCRISYFYNFNLIMKDTETTNITVKVSASKPEKVYQSNSTQLFEGTNATFTCKGNVGKPPGKFLWQKILKSNFTTINYANVTTVITEVPEMCTYNGTSVLIIMLTAEDNQAVMRCAEQSMTAMYQDSEPVNVFYKVRKPSITKHPNHEFYLVGSGDIKVTCNADANPQSNYIWYKEDNMTDSLSMNSTLIIHSMDITNSGTFVCYAFNNLSMNTYDTNETAVISIVYDIPGSSTSTQEIANKDKKVYERIDFVVVVSVLAVTLSSIALLTVSCVIRKYIFSQNKSKNEDNNCVIKRGHGDISSEKNLTNHYSLAMPPNEEAKSDLSDNADDESNCKTIIFYNEATKNTKACSKSFIKNPTAHYSLAKPQFEKLNTDLCNNTDCKCQKNVVHNGAIENTKSCTKRLLAEKIPEYATVTKLSKFGNKQSNILNNETSSLQIKDDIYADSGGLYDTLGNSRHKQIANCEKYDRTPKRRSPESEHSLHVRRIPEYGTGTKIPKHGNKPTDKEEKSGIQMKDINEDNTGFYDTLGNIRQKTNVNCEMYDHIPKDL